MEHLGEKEEESMEDGFTAENAECAEESTEKTERELNAV
jgi:hypothetical protein